LSALQYGPDSRHGGGMQKATPLVLVLVLAATAVFLSVKAPPAPSPAKQEVTATQDAAADDGEKKPTIKHDTEVAQAKPRPWPQDGSGISPDADAVFGTLENGMRYIIYPNSEPPARVSLRLHIAAGSLMEADDQQG